MHGKREFARIKENICNILVKTYTICNVLSRPVNNNGLVHVKLKLHLTY